MKIDVCPKPINTLEPSDILFQTSYWGKVKARLGWKPVAFDFHSSTGQQGDVMLLIRPLGSGLAAACVPQGPEWGPAPEHYGLFLEALSQEIGKHIDSKVAFIRYDLPWLSPYAIEEEADGRPWPGHPAPPLRELRMNMGTRTWNLRKASLDLTVADTLITDLDQPEADILAAMKPKTRYNIRLSQRKEVRVVDASVEELPVFYRLYVETARRNGFPAGSYRHFAALFSTRDRYPGVARIIFLLAKRGQEILAGAIVAISGRRALYLFGASANEGRNLMGSYALHWEAIKRAREMCCSAYDMGSVSPDDDPGHPFYGMYRFKTGFGGSVVHRNGSWDYLLDGDGYRAFRNYEAAVQLRLSLWSAG